MKAARCSTLGIACALVAWTAAPCGIAAAAAEPTELWQESWECGRPMHPSAELVLEAASAGTITRYPGRGDELPPFLVAGLPSPYGGAVVLAKTASGWRGFPIEAGASPQGVYVAPKLGSVVVIAMHTVEGPGESYTVLRATGGFASVDCRSVDFPADLNVGENGERDYRMEFLELEDFDLRPDGTGALVGRAVLNGEAVDERPWYRYTTADGGRTWSRPERLREDPPPIEGAYQRIDIGEEP